MYKLEATIADLAAKINDQDTANTFSNLAAHHRSTIELLLWDAERGALYDYDWQLSRRGALSAACVTPLFVGMATPEQSAAVAKTIAEKLLYAGGRRHHDHTVRQCQQWDKPNGWVPLQWMAIQGLRRFGENDLAKTLAERWLAAVGEHYLAQGKLVEKYDISGTSAAKGGGGWEYPLQDGFGWTNGVVCALLAQ